MALIKSDPTTLFKKKKTSISSKLTYALSDITDFIYFF